MKIVIVDTTIHGSLIGGGQLFLPGLMKGLVEKGHEVHLVVKDTPNEKVADFINASGAIVQKKPWKKKGLINDIAPLFAKWVNELKPDIFMISVSEDIGWVVLPLLDPAIATLTIGHNDSETFYMPARHYRSFLTRTIGVSPEMCEYYVSRCSIPAATVDWIPYGVSTSPAPPEEKIAGELKIVYVGRVVEEQKRISDVVAIARKLSEQHIDFKLKIIGDGPQMPEVRTQLQQEVAQGKVELTGWLKNPEIIEILRQSEVFILTSAYEGFCIALIEAIANGCCPVVTDIRSGNKLLVSDAVNGFVIEVGNTEKFLARLTGLANNPQQLNTLRLEAWKNGQQYSVSRMVASYETSFERACAEVRKSGRRIDTRFPLMESCRSRYPDWMRRVKMFITADN